MKIKITQSHVGLIILIVCIAGMEILNIIRYGLIFGSIFTVILIVLFVGISLGLNKLFNLFPEK